MGKAFSKKNDDTLAKGEVLDDKIAATRKRGQKMCDLECSTSTGECREALGYCQSASFRELDPEKQHNHWVTVCEAVLKPPKIDKVVIPEINYANLSAARSPSGRRLGELDFGCCSNGNILNQIPHQLRAYHDVAVCTRANGNDDWVRRRQKDYGLSKACLVHDNCLEDAREKFRRGETTGEQQCVELS